jgi:hypothetical protein
MGIDVHNAFKGATSPLTNLEFLIGTASRNQGMCQREWLHKIC